MGREGRGRERRGVGVGRRPLVQPAPPDTMRVQRGMGEQGRVVPAWNWDR